MFEVERLDLFTKVGDKFIYFCTLNDYEKFILLMRSNDAQIITWMAKFIHHSMTKMSDILLSKQPRKRQYARLETMQYDLCHLHYLVLYYIYSL